MPPTLSTMKKRILDVAAAAGLGIVMGVTVYGSTYVLWSNMPISAILGVVCGASVMWFTVTGKDKEGGS